MITLQLAVTAGDGNGGKRVLPAGGDFGCFVMLERGCIEIDLAGFAALQMGPPGLHVGDKLRIQDQILKRLDLCHRIQP
ncbi:hypothetical protein RG903_03670 [Thermithiobacillus tepidarius DSM 3134]|uniref:hypothetical protein n=1 Tax=Thermithiobacillus tepidarius TaxID=929 RepID=UPI001E2AB1C9|nr:hypothetical protein [Thermithiobacillus tepidarius]